MVVKQFKIMKELLNNKVAIVTGAGRGIGRSIAEKFATEGAIVYAVDLNETDLRWTDDVQFNFGKVYASALDICDFQAVKAEVMKIKKDNGRLDILVNNAGLISYELLPMIDYEKLRKMFEVNAIALIHYQYGKSSCCEGGKGAVVVFCNKGRCHFCNIIRCERACRISHSRKCNCTRNGRN